MRMHKSIAEAAMGVLEVPWRMPLSQDMIPIVDVSLMVPSNLLFYLALVGWHKLRATAAQA